MEDATTIFEEPISRIAIALRERRVSAAAPDSAAIPGKIANSQPAPVADGALEEVERRHIETVLNQTNWMIEGGRGAAKILNMNPSTLRSRMQKLNIKRPERV